MKAIVAVPTLHTKERLMRIFMNCPFNWDINVVMAVLAYLPGNAEGSGFVNTDVTFEAKFVAYKVLFDKYRNQIELAGVLKSPSMQARAKELGMPDDFLIKCVFLPYAPSMSSAVRNFNVSIADILVLKEVEPFTFQCEYLLSLPEDQQLTRRTF